MAAELPTEEGEESPRDSILDQFLRRLENDQEPSASPSTSGISMAAPASNYATSYTSPWQFMASSDPSFHVNPGLQSGLHLYRPPVPSSYLQPDEFPWFLDEFDQQRAGQGPSQIFSRMIGESDFLDSGQRHPPSEFPPISYEDQRGQEQFAGSSVSASDSPARESLVSSANYGIDHLSPAESTRGLESELLKGETAPSYRSSSSLTPESATKGSAQRQIPAGVDGRGGIRRQGGPKEEGLSTSHGSSSKLDSLPGTQSYDAEPVPRFGKSAIINVDAHDAKVRWERSSPSRLVESLQSPQFGASALRAGARPSRARPASPLLAEGMAGGSTNSAGTPNTSLSSGSTSADGDDDQSEKKEVAPVTAGGEGASSGKRKTPEPLGEEGDESVKLEKKTATTNRPRKRGGAKRMREPRYAIKTRTDVDVMDDGFKWRKYGQKAVKNSPHPRNYYRCTTPQCPVRKRVERSNEDAGLVITTYEGTHTHQTPGFHRSASGGYFGDRHLLSSGLFLNPGQSPLGPAGFGPISNLLPLPPGFDLASLQQRSALRQHQSFQGLTQQQMNTAPGRLGQLPNQSFQQQDSLLRAQQFLGLQDPDQQLMSVKQEPFQFTAQNFIPRGTQPPLNLPMRQFQIPVGHESPGPASAVGSQLQHRAGTSHPQGSPYAGLEIINFPQRVQTPSSNSSPPVETKLVQSNISRGQSGQDSPVVVGGTRIDQTLGSFMGGCSAAGPHNFVREQGLFSDQELDQFRAHQRPLQPRSVQGESSEDLQQGSSSHGMPDQSLDVITDEGLLQDMVRPGGSKLSS